MEITDLISITSSKERQDFTRLLQKRSKNGHDLSIQLFRAYLNGRAPLKKAEWGANRFNVIKKRLKDNLSSFIAEQIVEHEAQIEVSLIKQLLLARKLMKFDKYQSAHSLLAKTLNKANHAQQHAVANEIIKSMLACSLEISAISTEPILLNLKEGLDKYSEHANRVIANSTLKKAFIEAEYEGKEIEIDQEFEMYRQSLALKKDQQLNYKELLEMAEIADAQGTYTKNYSEVNVFFVDQMRVLEQRGKTSSQQLPEHIRLKYLVANIYFRKKEFRISLGFLKEMKKLMSREDFQTNLVFEYKYISLLALNFNFLGKNKRASLLLDQLILSSKFKVDNALNPILIRCMIAFQQGDYKLTAKLFANFQSTDKHYEKLMGRDWLLNMKYMEILLHMELQNDDFVESRINSLTKKHGAFLKSKSEFRVLPFLKLVKQVYRDPKLALTPDFEKKVDQVLTLQAPEQEDLFLMCFYAWLKSKMTGETIYQTTLDLLVK